MTGLENENKKTIKDLVNLSSNVGGSVTGAFLGFLVGGPPGALAGAALGPIAGEAIKKVGNEIANRLLSQREKLRVGVAIDYTAQKFDENLKANMSIRDDDFFKSNGERSTADEIIEGVLLTAQREYQEKKLRFHGNLLANIVFHPEIDKAQANMLIRLSERLSYRQLCILAILGQKPKFHLFESSYKDHLKKIDEKLGNLLQEIFQLYSEGILNAGGHALLGVANINPSMIELQGIGAQIFNLMELYTIDEDDLNEIAQMLK